MSLWKHLTHAALLTLILLIGTGAPARAGGDAINDAIGGQTSETSGSGTAPPAAIGRRDRSVERKLGKQTWPITDQAVSAIRVITGRPLNGADCREVLFDAKPMLRERFEVVQGRALVIPLENLCLFGFRNDSDERTIVLRVGESLDAIAISADPRLFAGLELAPYQQVSIPARPVSGKRLRVSLEILWADDLKSADAQVQSADLVFEP